MNAATSCLAVNLTGSSPKSVTANETRARSIMFASRFESPRNHFRLKMKNQDLLSLLTEIRTDPNSSTGKWQNGKFESHRYLANYNGNVDIIEMENFSLSSLLGKNHSSQYNHRHVTSSIS